MFLQEMEKNSNGIQNFVEKRVKRKVIVHEKKIEQKNKVLTMYSLLCFLHVKKCRFNFEVLAVLLVIAAILGTASGIGTCRVGELRCQNGDLCIPREKVCDGVRDCDDGLDEYVCKFRRGFYRNGPKKGAVFQCQFGGVIPLNRLCDGAVNCLDGSDESEICENNSCLPGQFRCEYGACIADWQMCNGRKNCPDGSDETAEVCQDIQCKDTEFRCRYGGCIRKTQICDVKKHCADGSDESEFLCLITRAKMLSEWEKEEKRESAKAPKMEQNIPVSKQANSVLPSVSISRFPPLPTKLPKSSENDNSFQSEKKSTENEVTISDTDSSSRLNANNGTQDSNDVFSTKKPQSNASAKDEGNATKDVLIISEQEPDKTGMVNKDETSSVVKQKEELDGEDVAGTPSSHAQVDENHSSAQRTVTCVLPEIPENAEAIISNCMFNEKPCNNGIRESSVGTQINYECDPGYSLYGPSVITCQEEGKWTLPPPICEVMLDVRFGLGSVIPRDFRPRCSSIVASKGTVVECIDPTDLSVKSCSELQKPGVEARLRCKPYYRPAGDLPIHYEKCSEKGVWSPGAFPQFSCVPDCGLSEVPKTPFIVNGKSIKRGQWPWHVGIYVEREGNLTYICGGALITEHAILTSAHCVTRFGSVVDPSKFKVFLGKQTITLPDNDPFVQSRHISKIFVDEAFNHRSLDSDIAIMALETPAVLSYFVRPVCYPQNTNSFLEEYQLAQGNLGTVLGWGATENQSLAEDLRMTELPVISHQDCVNAYRDFFASMTRSTNYCAGYRNGTSLCNGDSGGGQYFKAIVKGATRWYIQGLVSYGVPKEGSKKCSSTHYTVFTRVGRYADWMVRTLSRENLI